MVDVLKFAKSTSDARRLIAQGAVKVDGQVIQDVNFQFDGRSHGILEVGKNRIAQAKKTYKKLLPHIDNIGSFAYNILSLITSDIFRSLKTK